jgi:hypothetical protein
VNHALASAFGETTAEIKRAEEPTLALRVQFGAEGLAFAVGLRGRTPQSDSNPPRTTAMKRIAARSSGAQADGIPT